MVLGFVSSKFPKNQLSSKRSPASSIPFNPHKLNESLILWITNFNKTFVTKLEKGVNEVRFSQSLMWFWDCFKFRYIKKMILIRSKRALFNTTCNQRKNKSDIILVYMKMCMNIRKWGLFINWLEVRKWIRKWLLQQLPMCRFFVYWLL